MQQRKLRRQKMHDKRDPRTSYRIQVNDTPGCTLTYSVTTFPPGGKTSTETVRVGQEYRADVVPEWMRIAVEILDMAAVEGNALVPFFGGKVGNVYWLMSDQTQEGYDSGKKG